MAINWRILTLMILNSLVILHLIADWFISSHRKEDVYSTGPVTLRVTDHGAAMRVSLARLLAPARRFCSSEISPEVGSYTLGTNPLGRIFPRYIYFSDGSARRIKLILVIREDSSLETSVLKGTLRYKGLVYHSDKNLVLTIKTGDSFWIGQSEIKVR